jgi:hypothetical protein
MSAPATPNPRSVQPDPASGRTHEGACCPSCCEDGDVLGDLDGACCCVALRQSAERSPTLCQCRHDLAQHADTGQRRCLIASCGCGSFWALWPRAKADTPGSTS